jgi:hypothetical protein
MIRRPAADVGFFLRTGGRGVKLITNLHLILRIRRRSAIPQLPSRLHDMVFKLWDNAKE